MNKFIITGILLKTNLEEGTITVQTIESQNICFEIGVNRDVIKDIEDKGILGSNNTIISMSGKMMPNNEGKIALVPTEITINKLNTPNDNTEYLA